MNTLLIVILLDQMIVHQKIPSFNCLFSLNKVSFLQSLSWLEPVETLKNTSPSSRGITQDHILMQTFKFFFTEDCEKAG